MENIFNRLQMAKTEKDVETPLIEMIRKHFLVDVVHTDGKTDGVVNISKKQADQNKFVICEFKLDTDFSKASERAKAILQVLFYIKQRALRGEIEPAVMLIADKNRGFVALIKDFHPYLDREIDWTKSASTSWKREKELFLELSNDSIVKEIWVDDLDSNEKINNLCNLVEAKGKEQREVRITPMNIHVIFEDFKEKVLKDWKALGANKAVGVFMSCLLEVEKGNMVTPDLSTFLWYDQNRKTHTSVPINGEMFLAFWKHFNRKGYTCSMKERLISMSDEIIEETNRRFKGEFYTPSAWVDEAHKEMVRVYGENWKNEYVVWDCACGTGNLTRGYQFKELYMSTLNESDLIQAGYGNESATKFQFDFLNDEGDRLPLGLRKALKNGKVIFLINPPYAQSANVGKGATNTKIKDIAVADGMGNGVKDLYAQFIYRICQYHSINNDIHMGIFSKSTFLAGNSFEKFRAKLLGEFEYKYGMIFKASEFADVSDAWGILFSIWRGL